jgi:hypothetical protein
MYQKAPISAREPIKIKTGALDVLLFVVLFECCPARAFGLRVLCHLPDCEILCIFV